MNNLYFFNDKGVKFNRINKRTAEKAYNNGKTVIFCPVNVRPFTFWHLEIEISKNSQGNNGVAFKQVVNNFEFYNCNSETGKYTAFYMAEN